MRHLDNIVQTMNPRTKRYIKIDRVNGRILRTKKTKGPFKGIQIIRRSDYEKKQRSAIGRSDKS